MDRLKDKVAIVTGASGGIGKATAQLFLREGARVMATDIQDAKLMQWVNIAKQDGVSIEGLHHDVTRSEDWKNVVEKTMSAFGKIDILVNNAGIYTPGVTTENISIEEWNRTIAINLSGPFLGSKAVIGHMKNTGAGSIINISSIAGIVGGNGPAYTASKGALRLLTKDQAVEFAKYKIRVNSIHPGGVLTPMTDFIVHTENAENILKNMCPLERIGQPDEIAYGALYLASEEAGYTTGAELVIDGGLISR
jgi:NAD(P)-dependent dehydrogenase (short-subunit alcohol dehydrogenase family)